MLTITLIFNGVTVAHAATSMAFRHLGTAAELNATDPEPRQLAATHKAAPCHDMAKPVHTDSDLAAASAKAVDAKHAPDCCKSGGCNCECVHQSQAATAIGLVIGTALVHANSVRALKPAHAEAPLPHLIRPPIV